jgi:excisionase family DNA binding protein
MIERQGPLQDQAAGLEEAPKGSRSSRDFARLLTLPEVAEYLSVSPRTVRRLIGRGLPCVRLGRVVRFRPADLLRFVEARKE